VSQDLWQRVKETLDARAAIFPRGSDRKLMGRPRYKDESSYLLVGFAKCSTCGGPVGTDSRGWGPAGHGVPCRTMRAWIQSAAEKPSASIASLRQDLLDRAVLGAIGDVLDPAVLTAAVEKALARLAKRQLAHIERRAQVERELAQVQQRLDGWSTRSPTAPSPPLGLEIAAIHAESRQRYGSPRIHAELAYRGCHTSRKRVARLMRVPGLTGRRRRQFRVTTHSQHPWPVAPNVLGRQFTRSQPNQAWATDITYIPTVEGWLYVAVILDLCSRLAVGWAMSDRITDALTLEALRMALARRHPPRGLLHHSDRGGQYASGDYQRTLAQYGIVASMSRRANCWDNAVAESFFATVKVELVHDAAWATRAAARGELVEYLEVFYNGQRRHSALGYFSPRAFEPQCEHEALAT
jgi:putative transposase